MVPFLLYIVHMGHAVALKFIDVDLLVTSEEFPLGALTGIFHMICPGRPVLAGAI